MYKIDFVTAIICSFLQLRNHKLAYVTSESVLDIFRLVFSAIIIVFELFRFLRYIRKTYNEARTEDISCFRIAKNYFWDERVQEYLKDDAKTTIWMWMWMKLCCLVTYICCFLYKLCGKAQSGKAQVSPSAESEEEETETEEEVKFSTSFNLFPCLKNTKKERKNEARSNGVPPEKDFEVFLFDIMKASLKSKGDTNMCQELLLRITNDDKNIFLLTSWDLKDIFQIKDVLPEDLEDFPDLPKEFEKYFQYDKVKADYIDNVRNMSNNNILHEDKRLCSLCTCLFSKLSRLCTRTCSCTELFRSNEVSTNSLFKLENIVQYQYDEQFLKFIAKSGIDYHHFGHFDKLKPQNQASSNEFWEIHQKSFDEAMNRSYNKRELVHVFNYFIRTQVYQEEKAIKEHLEKSLFSAEHFVEFLWNQFGITNLSILRQAIGIKDWDDNVVSFFNKKDPDPNGDNFFEQTYKIMLNSIGINKQNESTNKEKMFYKDLLDKLSEFLCSLAKKDECRENGLLEIGLPTIDSGLRSILTHGIDEEIPKEEDKKSRKLIKVFKLILDDKSYEKIKAEDKELGDYDGLRDIINFDTIELVKKVFGITISSAVDPDFDFIARIYVNYMRSELGITSIETLVDYTSLYERQKLNCYSHFAIKMREYCVKHPIVAQMRAKPNSNTTKTDGLSVVQDSNSDYLLNEIDDLLDSPAKEEIRHSSRAQNYRDVCYCCDEYTSEWTEINDYKYCKKCNIFSCFICKENWTKTGAEVSWRDEYNECLCDICYQDTQRL